MKPTRFKVFIYTDPEFELNYDNVFISGVYRDVGQFRKENPGMRPLVSYEAEHIVKALSGQLRNFKKSTTKTKDRE